MSLLFFYLGPTMGYQADPPTPFREGPRSSEQNSRAAAFSCERKSRGVRVRGSESLSEGLGLRCSCSSGLADLGTRDDVDLPPATAVGKPQPASEFRGKPSETRKLPVRSPVLAAQAQEV